MVMAKKVSVASVGPIVSPYRVRQAKECVTARATHLEQEVQDLGEDQAALLWVDGHLVEHTRLWTTGELAPTCRIHSKLYPRTIAANTQAVVTRSRRVEEN